VRLQLLTLCGSISFGKWIRPAKITGWPSPAESGIRGNCFGLDEEAKRKSAAVTRTDMKHYCGEVSKFEAWPGWVNMLILRHSTKLGQKKSPHKKSRACKFREFF
jgi:hypothetical protein